MNIPSKIVDKAVREISQLPGIGSKSALRLALHLLKINPKRVLALSDALRQLAIDIRFCSNCHNISDHNICSICKDDNRDSKTICIVEDLRDVMAIENTTQFKGVYHILGGIISPMNGIGPSQLKIESLLKKVQEQDIKEVIFALSSTMEGDTTMFYIYKQLELHSVKISTLARGIALGDELEYTDETTLGNSLLNRIPYQSILTNK